MVEYKDYHLYRDIKERTGGEVFIGVVGPVRTGKSTFVRRFMSQMIIPAMKKSNQNIATDELPVSGKGKMITTVEPKFVPKEAARVAFSEGKTTVSMRLIDCVGYVVEGAAGIMDKDKERMVKTPWFDEEIPFSKAAHIGTQKVIRDHATIGIVITGDGSFGEIKRHQFITAEEETIHELKKIGKPFIILVNCVNPTAEHTVKLCRQLSQKHHVSVLPVNCDHLTRNEINEIMSSILLEFPISCVNFYMPKWFEMLPSKHEIHMAMFESAHNFMDKILVIKDIKQYIDILNNDYITRLYTDEINMATGSVKISIQLKSSYYLEFMSKMLDCEIKSEYRLYNEIRELVNKKQRFEKVSDAITQVEQKGYGAVMPVREDVSIEEPVIIKHGSKYGVKIKVNAPSIHMISANIETEIAPLVGTQQQAKDLIEYIQASYKRNGGNGLWDTLIFGKSMAELVDEGVKTKISKMTDTCQEKLQETLQKIINESTGTVIFIII